MPLLSSSSLVRSPSDPAQSQSPSNRHTRDFAQRDIVAFCSCCGLRVVFIYCGFCSSRKAGSMEVVRVIWFSSAGLTGGSHDSYVKHMVKACRKSGMRAVVFNSRGTSDGPVTTPQFYSASYTGDMRCGRPARSPSIVQWQARRGKEGLMMDHCAILTSQAGPVSCLLRRQRCHSSSNVPERKCRAVVKEMKDFFPDSVLLAAGWSLGGMEHPGMPYFL
jgi:hypothetical protein